VKGYVGIEFISIDTQIEREISTQEVRIVILFIVTETDTKSRNYPKVVYDETERERETKR
jgi:hypothetical protein